MSDLLSNFDKKVKEINQYFKLLRFLEDKSHIEGFKLDVTQSTTLKANCYLLLYNLIEGSIFEGIDSIFKAINQQNISFERLNDNYKQKWLSYSSSIINRDSKKISKTFDKELGEILDNIAVFSILDFKDKEGNKFDNYASYLKTQNKTDFSGTLDIRLIRDTLAPLYGFIAPIEHYDSEKNKRLNDKDKISEEAEAFLKVKNLRNKLAHGEISFSNAGQEPINDIRRTKMYIICYLRRLIKNIDSFIEQQGYLKQT
jgi:CRISPR/Cas system CMR-associated protein Cmr5 small subunit